ncbi:SLX9 [Candida theae]|uniref:Ribosome biogenesis protein SLX9 n=1 Tax=Candida theae TaxID=1198502 RepID=A0AAD5BFF4_9ASCO|nr:SLX9 [Candida theae]KAI5958223.1 SLX9 [Candida theae]
MLKSSTFEPSPFLNYHWDTFYSEVDFAKNAGLGLSLVRVPVGYWAFGLLEDDSDVKIKKKSSLRDKSQRKSQLANKITEFKESQHTNEPGYHENPLLKLAKTTKKQKQQEKSDQFINKLANKVTFNTGAGISKSSLRRRKRKEKEQLKPKMDELLLSLPTGDDAESKSTKLIKSSPTEFVDSKKTKKKSNAPNPTKTTGLKKIMIEEHKNFGNVLKNPEFRKSPFDALKSAIKQNMS